MRIVIAVLRWIAKSQFGRFSLVGSSAVVPSYVLFYVLTTWFGVWYVTASQLCFWIAAVMTFVFQKHWSFRSKDWKKAWWQGALYISVRAIFSWFNIIGVSHLVETIGFFPLAAQVCVMTSFAPLSYFVNLYIFRKKKADSQSRKAD